MIYKGDNTFEGIINGEKVKISADDMQEIIIAFKEYDFEAFYNLLDLESKKTILRNHQNKVIKNNNKEKTKTRNNNKEKTKTRKYNKATDIIELFNKYYNSRRTKKSVYEQIGKELNIKWKSVQKAHLNNKS